MKRNEFVKLAARTLRAKGKKKLASAVVKYLGTKRPKQRVHGVASESAVKRVVAPLVQKFIKKNYGRVIKKADDYLQDELDDAVQAWIDTIVEVVREAERGGTDDVSSLDYYNKAGDVATELFKMDAKGSKKSITNDLRDFEEEIMDDAFSAASK